MVRQSHRFAVCQSSFFHDANSKGFSVRSGGEAVATGFTVLRQSKGMEREDPLKNPNHPPNPAKKKTMATHEDASSS